MWGMIMLGGGDMMQGESQGGSHAVEEGYKGGGACG